MFIRNILNYIFTQDNKKMVTVAIPHFLQTNYLLCFYPCTRENKRAYVMHYMKILLFLYYTRRVCFYIFNEKLFHTKMNFIVHSIHTERCNSVVEPVLVMFLCGVTEDCARGCKNGIWPIKQI